MRIGWPHVLVASLALHLSALLTIYFGSHATRPPASSPSRPTDQPSYVLRETETLAPSRDHAKNANQAASVAVKPPANDTRAIPISPAPARNPIADAPNPSATTSPSLALEMNPNAHLRNLPPEQVLNPASAPQLEGHEGVVFVLDVSGSMYEPIHDTTRLQEARAELVRRIQALPDGTPFSVTLYAERFLSSGPLIAASDVTRDAAVRFVEREANCGGGTNLPDGLNAAAQLQVGSVVVISDGDLNMDVNDVMKGSAEAFDHNGGTPQLTIIGVSPREGKIDGKLLRALAKRWNGTYLEINSESGR